MKIAARLHDTLRSVAATLGTIPVASSPARESRFLPLSPDVRYAIAFSIVIPLWVAAMCFAFLARSGMRALVCCVIGTCVLAALSLSIPQ
jgi:hypothetical protein